jgi:hypothetical protein
LGDPFAAPGVWLRGNLHLHTTASDGLRAPAEAAGWFAAHGYDFVAITDHETVTPRPDGLPDTFLTLTAAEVAAGTNLAGEPYHLPAFGLPDLPPMPQRRLLTPQQAVDALRQRGAVVAVAHPYWSHHTASDLANLYGILGVEVWNGESELTEGRGHARVHWDDLLLRGRRLGGLGVDDCHWRGADYGLGWTWVKARARTPEAILAALRDGAFYASAGPELHHFERRGEELYIAATPFVSATLFSDGRHGARVLAADTPVTEATLPLKGARRFARVEVAAADGSVAWSPPIYLEG